MKILYVAAEAVPFAKTGGLADVAGSLPKALKADGVDVRVIMPKFGKIPEAYRNAMEHVYDGELPVAWRKKYVGLDKYELDGVTYYFVDNEEYFNREGFYGYDDDAERFSFFSRAVLDLLPAMDFWPDVIHTNDWHAGLVNVFLKLEHMGDARYERIKTVYTIHNLKYQGVFPKDVMPDVLGLDWKYFNNGDLEFYDAVNFMKGGIIYADAITTVSKTYAKEIQYPYELEDSITTKVEALAKKIYRAGRVEYTAAAKKALKRISEWNLEGLPVCVAKTQYSFSDDAKKLNVPEGYTFTVRDFVINTGSGMIVAIAGDIMRMPGLPKRPQSEVIDIVNGEIEGLA